MPDANDIMATLPVTASGYVNTNQVVYSLVMDSSIGDFDFNWVGLKDEDGVLISVVYIPLTQKRATAGAVPGNNLTRNFLVAYTGIQATTAISVPAETWQIDFTARLWGIDGRERLSNYDVYGSAAFFDDGWSVVRQGATTSYDVLPGIGYVGGIRIADATTQVITGDGPPKAVWLDVSLQGDISDVTAVVDFVIDNVGHADYTDGNDFDHYLAKIAEVAADGAVTDFRESADLLAPHEAEADPHPQYLTQAEADALYKAIATITAPTSSITAIPVNSVPTGYLECNGAAISRATYADLFAVIGTNYGVGDGSTTFNLPDLRGEFIRGFDNGRGIDSGRLIGSPQADELKAHAHDFSIWNTGDDSGRVAQVGH